MNNINLARDRLLKWCHGHGADLGCGDNKIHKDAVGLDVHNANAVDVIADIFCELPFNDNELDYIFSSHALEDAPSEDVPDILKRWIKKLRCGGLLTLYMPDKKFYYNVGHPKCNGSHKKDYDIKDILNITKQLEVSLVHCDLRGRWDSDSKPINASDWRGDESYGEWSFTAVFRKECVGV